MQRTQMEIIEYADKYKEWVNSLIARLQNFERTIESDRLPGEEMTEKYLDHIVSECRKKDGKIYVAKMGEEIVGFVSAWVENGKGYVVSEKEQWLYVSDIFVAPEFRGKSIATLLIDHMESYAKESKAKSIQFDVLAKNIGMRSLAQKLDYEEYEIRFRKKL